MFRLAHQAVWRRERVPHAGALWAAVGQIRWDHSSATFESSVESDFTDDHQDTKAPITVKFEIPYFTISGVQVRYLKIVEKSGYQALPWVRYITQHGDDYRCVRTRHFANRLIARQPTHEPSQVRVQDCAAVECNATGRVRALHELPGLVCVGLRDGHRFLSGRMSNGVLDTGGRDALRVFGSTKTLSKSESRRVANGAYCLKVPFTMGQECINETATYKSSCLRQRRDRYTSASSRLTSSTGLIDEVMAPSFRVIATSCSAASKIAQDHVMDEVPTAATVMAARTTSGNVSGAA
jgi:hypothetical protein